MGIRYGSVRLLLYGPVMLLPLPILTFIVRLASYLNSTADKGRKGLFLLLALSVEKRTPFTSIFLKTFPFLSQFLWSEECHIYWLAIAWVLKLTGGELLRISCPHEYSGNLGKNTDSGSGDLEWSLRVCVSSIPGNNDSLHFEYKGTVGM